MRRAFPVILTLCLVSLVSLVGLVGCSPAPLFFAAHPARRPRYLIIGDSLTGGWFASDAAQDYVSLVTADEHATAIDTHGVYGVTTPHTLAALQRQAPPTADVVILELGTNDVSASEPPAAFASAYGQMIALLRRAEPRARFVCLGVWRDPQPDGATPAGWPYDQVIEADCPGTFVWLGGLYMTMSLHGPLGRMTWKGAGDWFHPNNAGHAAIARAVEAALG